MLGFIDIPRLWFNMSGLKRFGLFIGISRWFAADNSCGAAECVGAETAIEQLPNTPTHTHTQLQDVLQFGECKDIDFNLIAM